VKIFCSKFWLMAGCFIINAGWSGGAVANQADRVSQLIVEGDDYSEKQFDNQKALDKFLEADKASPKNCEILWRISRSYVDLGEHLGSSSDEDKEKQLGTYQKALDYANQAVEANPQSSMAYCRRAIATGRVALFKGVFSVGGLVNATKADCEKAIALDPSNAAAYYVLARGHAKLVEKPKIIRWPLGLAWGNIDDAIKNYEKAIALKPNFIMYRLDAARAYVENDDYKKAKEYLSSIPSLPKMDEDDDQFRKDAKELFDKIKDKE
jgi:tetratricopeptide (TPR) repeat protein